MQTSITESKSSISQIPEPVITSKKQEEPKKDIFLPEFIDKELWSGFLEMRLSMKAQNSELALSRIIKKLTKFKEQGIDPNETLDNSIVNSWKGIFPPKKSYEDAHKNNSTKGDFRNT
jgi:hypothetical protein